MNKSKTGHVLYLMVNFPLIVFWKIGITGKTAKGRAKQVDRAVFGKPIVVMVVPIPGAYLIEQDLHRRFRWMNCRYYRGDGSTEWFWFPVVVVVLPFMVAVWAGYVWAFDWICGTHIFEFLISLIL